MSVAVPRCARCHRAMLTDMSVAVPRCARCHKALLTDEFIGRDAAGRAICTRCEEEQGRRMRTQERILEVTVALALALAGIAVAAWWVGR